VLASTQLMNLAFIGPLKHAGLALSIGLGACINAFCLMYFLIKKDIYTTQIKWKRYIAKILLAILFMAICLFLSMHYLPLNFTGESWLRVASLCVLMLIAGVSYFAALFALGFRPRDFSFHE
jgi:putative peptidoglycan lipid II flippase